MKARVFNIDWIWNEPYIVDIWNGESDRQIGCNSLSEIVEEAERERLRLPTSFIVTLEDGEEKTDYTDAGDFAWINDLCGADLCVCNCFEMELIKEE